MLARPSPPVPLASQKISCSRTATALALALRPRLAKVSVALTPLVGKVSNSRDDLQCYSGSLALVPFDSTHVIFY